ncbi:T9SS type A sorting domain-containing protein [Sediminibacter sp. Hel_I_10]|uniref:T9SS type A sorting domain-containing protein n=1 Tax=Sediminibacter sp. Hel_I_10 TaxID=1392490 RepID=UPI00047A5639|nr:T9SS type A sorting domain-containing protein [Sediminibacter sp. Hel_I_10]
MKNTYFFFSAFTFTVVLSFSQNVTFSEKILTPGEEFSSVFGVSVDIQESVLVGSDPSDLNGAVPSTGAAYIYRKNNNGNFEFEQKLKAPLLEAGDVYGTDVAINGDFIAVGSSRYEFANTTSGLPIVNKAGAVFLYKYNTNTSQWDLVNQIFAPTRLLFHEFGWRLLITDTQLFISEIYYKNTSVNALRTGKVHIYDYDNDGNVTYNQGVDNPEPTSHDFFGSEIALSGNTLAVGARGEQLDENGTNQLTNAGAVYIFEKDDLGFYNLQQKILPNPRVAFANFGEGLDIYNNTLAVGAVGEVSMVPGTSDVADCGVAYIFKKIGSTWSQTASIIPPTVEFNANYGSSINLKDNIVFIGYEGGRVPYNGSTRNSGLVEQITLDNSGQVTNKFTIAPPFPDTTNEFGYITSWDGNQLAVGVYADRGDIDGNLILSGTVSPGAIYVYDTNATLSTNAFSSVKLKVTNPVKEEITVFNLKEKANYTLYDLYGKLILQGNIITSNPSIDLSLITNGIYLLSIHSKNSPQDFKIIKK